MLQLLRIGIILFACQSVFAQQHYYRQYTIADGMPQTETTQVFIDQKGYIWAGYANGWISRFDGLTFRNFSPEELGMSHHTYAIFEDDTGLWVWDQQRRLSLLREGKWTPIHVPEPVIQLRHYRKWGILGLDKSGNLLHYSHEEKTWSVVCHLEIPHLQYNNSFYSSFLGATEKVVIILRFHHQELEYWEIPFPACSPVRFIHRGGKILFSGSGYRYWQDQSGNILYEKEGAPPRKMIDQSSDAQPIGSVAKKGFWVHARLSPAQLQRKIYWMDAKGNMEEQSIIEQPVRRVTVDQYGHFWLASQTGLLKLSPWEKSFFDDQPGMIPNLHCIAEDSEGNIWMGGYRDGWVYYDGHQINSYPTGEQKLHLLPGSYRSPSGEHFYWSENHGPVFIDRERKWHTIPLYKASNDRPLPGYYFLPLSNGDLGLGTTERGIGLLSPPYTTGENCRFIGKDKGMLLDNVLCLEEDRKGRIWCGRHSQGIALYDRLTDTAYTWLISDHPNPGLGALSMELDNKGNLWLGTNKGLYFLSEPHLFHPSSDSLFLHLQPVKISEAGQSLVVAMKAHRDWLIFSNAQGHGFIDLNSFYFDPEMPRVLFTHTASPEKGGAGEQNALLVDQQQRIWIGKDRGAVCIDFDEMPKDTALVKMAEPELLAGGDSIAIFDSVVDLPLNKRSLEVHLRPAFIGSTDRKVQFWYRLSGHGIRRNHFTTLQQQPEINFDYLSPGDYQLEIEMYRHNQLADRRMLNIHVPGTLSEHPAFWFSLALLLFLLIGTGYHFRRRAELLQKKADLDRASWNNKLQQTRIQALTSSLNPHFINNSLNWLQYKVIEDKQAVAVVGRLSENIRLIFQHSRAGRPDHSLKEELRLVENYLYIQNARYDERLDARLPDLSDQPALTNIHVPIMQLLIHVENAIEHGLRNRRDAKMLQITAALDGDYLSLTVTDDGIGRRKTKDMKSHGTQEGTKMLEELHQILNRKNKLKIKTWYEDHPFTDENTGEGYGTNVCIQIPILFDYRSGI